MDFTERIAEVIYKSRPRRIEWEDLTEVGWKAEYRRMAAAVVEELQAMGIPLINHGPCPSPTHRAWEGDR